MEEKKKFRFYNRWTESQFELFSIWLPWQGQGADDNFSIVILNFEFRFYFKKNLKVNS